MLAPSVGDQYLPESIKLYRSLVSLPPTALASPWPLCGTENVCPQLGGKAKSLTPVPPEDPTSDTDLRCRLWEEAFSQEGRVTPYIFSE